MREENACRIRIRIVRCLLYIVTWVPDDGTYTSERYPYTVLMSEPPLCLTRYTSVTLSHYSNTTRKTPEWHPMISMINPAKKGLWRSPKRASRSRCLKAELYKQLLRNYTILLLGGCLQVKVWPSWEMEWVNPKPFHNRKSSVDVDLSWPGMELN